MKKLFSTLALVLMTTATINAQDVTGKWKTIDDETGKAKSIVEIYKEDGKIYGNIIEILDPKKKNTVCVECKGSDKGKRIEGLVILKGLEKDGEEYSGGTIVDPTNGKVYKSYIALEEDNLLKVRGYIGFSLIGRTQYWIRTK